MTVARVKIVASFVATFVLGVMAGGAADHAIVARQAIDMFDASARGSRHGVFLWSLERKLDLTSSQSAKIGAILQRYDGEMRAAAAPVEAKTGEVRSRMRGDIRAELAGNQRPEFDRLMAAHDATRGRAPSLLAPLSPPPASQAQPLAPPPSAP